MTGVVLAGGENRRFPYHKAMIRMKGKTILENTLEVFGKFFSEVILSTNDPELFFRFGVSMVGDVIGDRGPMTGILSAMLSSRSEWFFVVACDMPFIHEELVAHLVSLRTSADAVIPVYGEPQPLFGLYHRRLIEPLYAKITGGRKGMCRFLREINTHYVDEDRVREFDPDGNSFININSLDDLKKVRGGGEKCSG
jgi:molybdopterin-guanine dinucleotide biosynthesis protein A